jgi:hypothetical protein
LTFPYAAGFFCLVKSPGKLLEDVDHLLVRNLAEISGISTDGAEKLVVFEADNVIGLAAQLVARLSVLPARPEPIFWDCVCG